MGQHFKLWTMIWTNLIYYHKADGKVMIAICCVMLVKLILSWEASCVVKIKTQKRLMQW